MRCPSLYTVQSIGRLTVFNDVRDIEQGGGQNAVVDLELCAEARHLQDEHGRDLLQLDVGREERLLEQPLHGRHLDCLVLLHKELVKVRALTR